jgi:hypothetical protein
MALVEMLAEAFRADTGRRPDHRCAWRHVVRDYPAPHMGDKTFSDR